jgi:hypothetical protein
MSGQRIEVTVRLHWINYVKGLREHAALSPMRRKAPGDRFRMGFRKSCMAAIEIIYESAVLGSQGADEKLRSYAIELNREAVLLAEGLLGIWHPSDVSRQQKTGDLTRNRSSRKINDRSRITNGIASPAANLTDRNFR